MFLSSVSSDGKIQAGIGILAAAYESGTRTVVQALATRQNENSFEEWVFFAGAEDIAAKVTHIEVPFTLTHVDANTVANLMSDPPGAPLGQASTGGAQEPPAAERPAEDDLDVDAAGTATANVDGTTYTQTNTATETSACATPAGAPSPTDPLKETPLRWVVTSNLVYGLAAIALGTATFITLNSYFSDRARELEEAKASCTKCEEIYSELLPKTIGDAAKTITAVAVGASVWKHRIAIQQALTSRRMWTNLTKLIAAVLGDTINACVGAVVEVAKTVAPSLVNLAGTLIVATGAVLVFGSSARLVPGVGDKRCQAVSVLTCLAYQVRPVEALCKGMLECKPAQL